MAEKKIGDKELWLRKQREIRYDEAMQATKAARKSVTKTAVKVEELTERIKAASAKSGKSKKEKKR